MYRATRPACHATLFTLSCSDGSAVFATRCVRGRSSLRLLRFFSLRTWLSFLHPDPMDSCNEEVACRGPGGFRPDDSQRELASSAFPPLYDLSLRPPSDSTEVAAERHLDTAPVSLGVVMCASPPCHARHAPIESPPFHQELPSSAAAAAAREPTGLWTEGAPAGPSSAGALAVSSSAGASSVLCTAGTPASRTPTGVTTGSAAASELVDRSAAGTSGGGPPTTGAAAGAATTASAALPLATAAASGAVRVPGAEEDLHRYELLLSEAEDFGETW